MSIYTRSVEFIFIFLNYPLDKSIILCYNMKCQEDVNYSSFLYFMYEINYTTNNNSYYCSFINFSRHNDIWDYNFNK